MITNEELKEYLFNLSNDLDNSTNEMVSRLFLYKMTKEDRYKYFSNMYLKDNLPTKVTNYDSSFISKDFDLEIYDRFLDNLDDYVRSQEKQLDELIVRHQMAVKIFRLIITLPYPICDIMYLTYFKNRNVSDIVSTLFISRPTYFRLKRKGFNMLLDMLNQTE